MSGVTEGLRWHSVKARAERSLAEDKRFVADVDAALAEGWSWRAIGDVLGVAKGNAHARYGRTRERLA